MGEIDGATLLANYLHQNGLSATAFAGRIGVDGTCLTRAMRRVRNLDVYRARKVHVGSGGAVPAESWGLVKIKRHSKR